MTTCCRFLSTVTREILTCRQRLADDLCFPQVAVGTQENIAKLASGDPILLKRDDYLAGCDTVIHLIEVKGSVLTIDTQTRFLAPSGHATSVTH